MAVVRNLHRGNETILLVEEDAAARKAITRMLERLGYDVVSAKFPAGALTMLRDQGLKTDLAIFDLHLPGMNGHELAERIREFVPEIRIIYLSCAFPENEIPSSRASFQKPVSYEAMALKVRETLDLDPPAG